MPVTSSIASEILISPVADAIYGMSLALHASVHLRVFLGSRYPNENEADPASYTVELIGPAYSSFNFTPSTDLIAAMAAAGEDSLELVRELPLTTDFADNDAFVREKIMREFERTAMRMQQINENLGTGSRLDVIVSEDPPSGIADENTIWIQPVP